MRVLAIDEVPIMSVLPRFLFQLRDTDLYAIEQGFRPSREASDGNPPTSAPLAVPQIACTIFREGATTGDGHAKDRWSRAAFDYAPSSFAALEAPQTRLGGNSGPMPAADHRPSITD